MNPIFKNITIGLVLTAIVLSAISSFANETDHQIITPGKLEAVAADFCAECMLEDNTLGKIDAAMFSTAELMLKDSELEQKQIQSQGETIGLSMEDSKGLIKLFGVTEDLNEQNLIQMRSLVKKMNHQSGDALNKSFEAVLKLSKENKERASEALRIASELN